MSADAMELITTVADIPRVHAQHQPQATALVCDARRTTFATLDRRVSQIAHGLIAITAPHARVAILDRNADTFYELLFGTARANRVLVPIDPRLTVGEIAHVLADADVDLVIVGAELAGRIDELRQCGCRFSRALVVGGASDLAPSYDAWRDGQPDTDPLEPFSGDDVVLLMYTSGTTGYAKGVPLTHRNMLVLPPVLEREYGCGPTDVSLVCLPVFHVSGGLWGLASLYSGITTVVLRTITPADIVRTIAEHRVTKTFVVPALIARMLEDPTLRAHDCSSLDLLVYGGSPIPERLLRAALDVFSCRFTQLYGLTETCGALTYLRPEDHDLARAGKLHSCGTPLPGVELRVVDRTGREVAAETRGEVVCRAETVMTGYWRRPAETQEAFRDGWFRTGDIGFRDADGYLYLVDRLKDMILTGGENVYPAEVEQVLAQHAGVGEVAVIGVPDARWGEAVTALVVAREPDGLVPSDLVSWARERLAGFKTPKSVHLVDRLPRNAAGKVLRRELRGRLGGGALATALPKDD